METPARARRDLENQGKDDGEPDEGNPKDGTLDHDTFTLMMRNEPKSQAWFLALSTYFVQSTLVILIIVGEEFFNERSEGSFGGASTTTFGIPIVIKPEIYVGQALTLILAVFHQEDIVNAIRHLTVLWNPTAFPRKKTISYGLIL